MPGLRASLTAGATGLALIATWTSGFSLPLSLALSLFAPLIAARAWRVRPRVVTLRIDDDHVVDIRCSRCSSLRGRAESVVSTPLYCAFRVRDPAKGARVVGLFRDELEPLAWRRLQVLLRTG